MLPIHHDVFHISSIEDICSMLSGYSHIDVENTLLVNFMDQLNDYAIDREKDGEQPATIEEQLEYLNINYTIDELVYSVLRMVEDCDYKFIINEEVHDFCVVNIIDSRPSSKEELIKYITCHWKEFDLSMEELTSLITEREL